MSELKIDSNSIENGIFRDGNLVYGLAGADSYIYADCLGTDAHGYISGTNSYIKAGGSGCNAFGMIYGVNNNIVADKNPLLTNTTGGAVAYGCIGYGDTIVENSSIVSNIGSTAFGAIISSSSYIYANGAGSLAHGFIRGIGIDSYIKAGGVGAVAEGCVSTGFIEASGNGAIAVGCASSGNIIASGAGAVAMGINTRAYGDGAVAMGIDTLAGHRGSHASGIGTFALSEGETVVGKYNDAESLQNPVFIVGCGISSSKRKNAIEAYECGKVFINDLVVKENTEINENLTVYGQIFTPNADYSEYFEWSDGNPENEDRIGHFVSIAADGKIQISNSTKETIGVISGFSSIIGNTAEDYWHGKYLRDIYGRYIYEDIEVNDNIDSSIDSSTNTHTEKRRKLNPEYDPNKTYIPRSQRKEWAVVGLMGLLIVIDDGTCQVGKHCGVTKDGTATNASTGFKVLQRLDDTHIKILFK